MNLHWQCRPSIFKLYIIIYDKYKVFIFINNLKINIPLKTYKKTSNYYTRYCKTNTFNMFYYYRYVLNYIDTYILQPMYLIGNTVCK